MKFNICGLLGLLLIVSQALQGQTILTVNPVTGSVGDVIEVDITAENLTGFATLQFEVEWDTMDLEYQTSLNFSSEVLGFDITDVGDPSNPAIDNGMIRVTWFDEDSEERNFTDGEVLMTIQFLIVGEECTETVVDMDNIEILNSSLEEFTVNVNPGLVTIDGADCGGGNDNLVLDIAEVTGMPGDQVCVPVIATNFSDIIVLEFDIEFDASVLEYVGLGAANLPGFSSTSVGDANAAMGNLIVVWTDPTVSGQDIPDGGVVFELCFDIIGEIGDVGVIRFDDIVGVFNSNNQPVTTDFISGSVTVTDDTTPLTFVVGSDLNACPQECVTIPVTVRNFEAVNGFNFSLDYNPDVLEYKDKLLPANVLNGFNLGDITHPPSEDEGDIRVLWTDPSSLNRALNDGDTLFMIEFTVVGEVGETSVVAVTDEPLGIDCNNEDGTIVCVSESGEVAVNCSLDCELDMIMNAECDGDGMGSIFISVSGGSGNYSYNWSNGAMSEDLVGVPVASYSVTITDNENSLNTTCGPFEIVEEFDISDNTVVTPDDCGGGDIGAIDLEICGDVSSISWEFEGSVISNQEDISNLETGRYTVTIVDANGNQVVREFQVTAQSDAMISNVDLTQPNPGMNDGAIDITVNGSFPPFSFMWDNGEDSEDLSGIGAGCYNVTIEDNEGCTASFGPYCIGQTGDFELNIITSDFNGSEISCNGAEDGSITITPVNGLPPYSFSWSNPNLMGSMVDNLPAGAYGVTVTDGNDESIQTTINITEPTALNVSFNNQCAQDEETSDGAFVANVTGGTPTYEYSWNGLPFSASNRLENQMAGAQASLVVRDANGCELNLGQSDVPDMCIDGGECFTSVEVISPNGDGRNDFLRISCIGGLDADIEIFDNSGERIYAASNYQNDWPSVQESEELDDNVYYWLLTVTNGFETQQYRGYVTVLLNLD